MAGSKQNTDPYFFGADLYNVRTYIQIYSASGTEKSFKNEDNDINYIDFHRDNAIVILNFTHGPHFAPIHHRSSWLEVQCAENE